MRDPNRSFFRYARILIAEYEPDETSTASCGIKRVVWSGCRIPVVSSNLPCGPDTTGIANNITTYRHVSWDPFNELFYLCDVSPGRSGLTCRANVAGTSQWKDLPRSIRNIEGYSPTRAKMFFSDLNGTCTH
jgi:hypothetical protein